MNKNMNFVLKAYILFSREPNFCFQAYTCDNRVTS